MRPFSRLPRTGFARCCRPRRAVWTWEAWEIYRGKSLRFVEPDSAESLRTLRTKVTFGEGVKHLWFVEPVGRSLQAFELKEGGWVSLGAHGADTVSLPPFDDIDFPLDTLWP